MPMSAAIAETVTLGSPKRLKSINAAWRIRSRVFLFGLRSIVQPRSARRENLSRFLCYVQHGLEPLQGLGKILKNGLQARSVLVPWRERSALVPQHCLIQRETVPGEDRIQETQPGAAGPPAFAGRRARKDAACRHS